MVARGLLCSCEGVLSVAMQLLECCESFPGQCYTVARVFRVVA